MRDDYNQMKYRLMIKLFQDKFCMFIKSGIVKSPIIMGQRQYSFRPKYFNLSKNVTQYSKINLNEYPLFKFIVLNYITSSSRLEELYLKIGGGVLITPTIVWVEEKLSVLLLSSSHNNFICSFFYLSQNKLVLR